MLQSKSFVKKTKGGKVVKVVREHYLRDDIYCGASICKTCDSSVARLSSDASTIIIVDTNVVLNQVLYLNLNFELKFRIFMTNIVD
ncbi:hypothetical protein SOVF_213740 [Spinacia oleracea]|nr:hypothetical protein SOVF_213740 [Spinacia oleracea]